MAKPDLLKWVSGDEAAKITDPGASKKLAGFLYLEKVAMQQLNWLFNRVSKWFLHLQGGHYDIIVGSAAQVTALEATHVLADLDDVLVIAGTKVLILDGTHTLLANFALTNNTIKVHSESVSAIIDVATFTFTLSGNNVDAELKIINSGIDEVIISGAGSLFKGIDLPIDNVLVADGSAAVTTGTTGGIKNNSITASGVNGDININKTGTGQVHINGLIQYSEVGEIIAWPKSTPKAGTLETDGSLIEITLYENLYDEIGNDYGLNTGVTFTAAATDIITSAAHGKVDNDIIEFTNSGGALPAGLSIDTKYFIITSTTNTFKVSLTLGGAAVDITGTGTGTHSFHDEVKIPDLRGEFLRGWDHGLGSDPDAASRTDRGDGTTGDVVGSKQSHEINSHLHLVTALGVPQGASGTGASSLHQGGSTSTRDSNSTGGNETRPRNVNVMYCIKF